MAKVRFCVTEDYPTYHLSQRATSFLLVPSKPTELMHTLCLKLLGLKLLGLVW